MARVRLTVRQLANESGLDIDETLVILWDANINVDNQNSPIRKGDANKARRVVGITTRRELSSISFWQSSFRLNDSDFELLLEKLDIPVSLTEKRLTKKIINKLRAESRAQGVAVYNEPALVAVPAEKAKPFVWETIGKQKDLLYLDADTITAIHYQLAQDFSEHHDPIDPPGVRPGGLLESAVMRPHTSFLGEVKKYPSLEMAAAALMHSLVHDHPFHNGNKRSALVSTLVFLDKNGLLLTCSEDDLFRLILKVAQHSVLPYYAADNLADREVLEISRWIGKNSRVIEGGERIIPFRRLRRILNRRGCQISPPKSSAVTITRSVERRIGILRPRTQEEALFSKIAYSDEGRDIERETIAKVRKELKLDDFNGTDSASFYDNAPDAADGFIAKYRKILYRLAQL